MAKVIGVRFLQSCRPYYFDAGEIEAERGEKVIVSTSKGTDIGVVLFPPTEMPEEKIVAPLQPVLRLATPEDLARVDANRIKEKEAFGIAKEKIELHNPEMKLVGVEYAFDGSKILFYFIADGRVDFRELVRDLASVFRTRIELRQIGVRDEARMKGGIGVCGRELCCVSYMADFAPVSIKMAKDQNLSLNPTKISGNCGRLMCCLKNEEDTYEYLNAQMPRVGKPISLPNGETGTVASVNVLRQTVRVLFINEKEEKEIREYTLDQIRGTAPLTAEKPAAAQPEEPEPEPVPEVPAEDKPSGSRRQRDRRRGRPAGAEEKRGPEEKRDEPEKPAAENKNTRKAPAAAEAVRPSAAVPAEPVRTPEDEGEAEAAKSGRSRRRRRPDKAAGKGQAPEAADRPAPQSAAKPSPQGAGKAPDAPAGEAGEKRQNRRRRYRPKKGGAGNHGGAAE